MLPRGRGSATPGRRAGLAVVAWLVAWTTSAAAQVTPPPPELTPPVARSNTDVSYPPHANGDAVVLLELTVGVDGAVLNAAVVDGVEPFAEQARQAVLGWRFVPAHRGSTPVAARVRARVDFHQEQPSAASAVSPPVFEPLPSPRHPRPRFRRRSTFAARDSEIGETTLSAADIREMPGAFGDPFRAIEALPGVAPVVSGLPFFYIRGAPPNDNAYFVDGIRVPLLFHVGIGEGVIHPALIDHVDFYPGAAPAAYGGSAGAVIAGQTRDPAATPHGEASVRLIDAGALLESPLGDGRGSALVAGRYGYPGPIVGAITPTVKLGYWDYQARLTWRVGDRDTLGVFAFGSHDYLGAASTHNGQAGPIVEQLASDFHRVDLRYDRALVDGHLRIAATLGYDSQGGSGEGDGPATVTTITNLSAAAASGGRQEAVAYGARAGGADVRLDDYGFAQGQATTDQNGSPQPQSPLGESADPPPTNVTAGRARRRGLAGGPARRDRAGRALRCVRVDARERAVRRAGDHDGPCIRSAPLRARDPHARRRLALHLRSLAPVPALRVGAVPAMLLSVPGFPLGDSQLQTVAQASQGVEVALPADFTLTTTGFLSGWSGLTDLTANCIQIMPATTSSADRQLRPHPPAPPYTCPEQPARPRPRVRRRGAAAKAALEAPEWLALLHAVAIDAR